MYSYKSLRNNVKHVHVHSLQHKLAQLSVYTYMECTYKGRGTIYILINSSINIILIIKTPFSKYMYRICRKEFL